jgi:hypothetical protein
MYWAISVGIEEVSLYITALMRHFTGHERNGATERATVS